MKKAMFILITSLFLVVSLIGVSCSSTIPTTAPQASTTAPAPKPTSVSTQTPVSTTPTHKRVDGITWTNPFGGIQYILPMAMIDIINKHHPWIHLTGVESLGGSDNIIRTAEYSKEGKKYLWFAANDTAFWTARYGIAPNPKTYPDLRWVLNEGCSIGGFMTRDPKIKTWQDMIGKTVLLASARVGSSLVAEYILKDVWGIWDKVKVIRLGYPDFKDAMMEGRADACVFNSFPAPKGYSLVPDFDIIRTSTKLYYVGMSKEEVKKLAEVTKTPQGYVEIPANTQGLDNLEPFGSYLSSPMAMACWKDADEEFIYEVVKCMAENVGEMVQYRPSEGGVMASDVSRLAQVSIQSEEDIHPGALRYFKERNWKLGVVAF